MRKFLIFSMSLLVFFNISFLLAQEKKQIKVEWIFSDESDELTKVPRFFWLKDNTAILYDERKSEELRSFEIFNPNTLKRRPIFDMKKSLASLKTFLGAEDSTSVLPWPDAFDDDGRRAVYIFEDDIFILNLIAAGFQRVTETKEVEKSVKFSPNGKMLAYVRENNLYIYNIEKRQEKPLTSDSSETILNGTLSWVYWEEIFGRRDIGYWWSDDSRSIAYLQTDETPVTMMHYVDFKPQVPRLIKQRYPKAGTDNPIVRVGVVEINTRNLNTTWMELPDYEYLARVKWLQDNKRLCVQTMNREQTKMDLYLVDRITGKAEHLMTESDTAWININDDLYFLDDGKHFIWQSERDGYAHLYRFTLDGKLVNQITRGDWSLRSSGGVFWLRKSITAIDEEKKMIYFTALEKSSVERHLYRIKFDGTKMQRLSREDGTHRITFSHDAKFYFDSFSNIRTLPSLSLHTADGALKKEISEPRSDLLAELEFQYPKLITIPTTDGFPMPAEILKPKDFDANQKYPIIFHIYAGPSAPTVFNSWNSNRYFDQILLRKGYLVVRFDHRSATAISKKLENRLNRMMSGPIEMRDIVDGVKWLKSLSYVDEDRFGIWGWSGGGSFTLNAMTNTEEFKAGISVAPVTDWQYYDTKWAEFAMKKPQDNPEGYKKTSYLDSAKNLHGRLLLVHGTYDDNVHPQNSWAFIDELIEHNVQFDMMFYPMRKHDIKDRPAKRHLYTKMLEFWENNL
jgi:dipeptidyl-peptidase-4